MFTVLLLAVVIVPALGTCLVALTFIVWAVVTSTTRGPDDGAGNGGGGNADPS